MYRNEIRSKLIELHNLFEGGFDFSTARQMAGLTDRIEREMATDSWSEWTRRLELAAA